MKGRLLFLSLLCLIGVGLNAQGSAYRFAKSRKAHRNEQKAVVKDGKDVKSFRYWSKSGGTSLTRAVTNKYYPPKVNREYFSYNTDDGSTTFRYRMYYELDQWGNVLLEERGNEYRTMRTFSDKTNGKMQLSEYQTRWNGVEWVEDFPEDAFYTQLNGDGIRVGVTRVGVEMASFNEKGYLTRLHEVNRDSSNPEDRAKVEVEWKDDFPMALRLVSYGDSISLKDLSPMYEMDKFNPYLCFTEEWSDFFFDSEGDDFVLFNANLYWSSDDNEEGIPVVINGKIESSYVIARENYYQRIMSASVNGITVPVIIETKKNLDGNGSFTYAYEESMEKWGYSVTKIFNEYGDLVRQEEIEKDGETEYKNTEIYEREYDVKGYPVRTLCRIIGYYSGNQEERYIETYGEKITTDTSLEVEVKEPGTLGDVVWDASPEYYNLRELKVTGPINEGDLNFIRIKLSSLQVLDLGAARMTYLPEGIFQYCNLVSMVLPGNLKMLSNYALAKCPELRTVELPASLNMLGQGVFSQCDKLERIICRMAAPVNIEPYADPFEGINRANCRFVVSEQVLNSYLNNTYWGQYTIEGSESIEISDPVIVNGILRLDGALSDRNANITLGYGAGLEIGQGDYLLRSLVMYHGDRQMHEPLGLSPYGYWMFGRRVAPSSLINGANVKAAEVRIEHLCQGGKWYFLSFPFDVYRRNIIVEKLDTLDHTNAEYVIRYYDGAKRAFYGVGQSWTDVSDDYLRAGQGYIFQASREVRLIVSGNDEAASQMLVPAGNIGVNEYVSTQPSNQGWNMVGNPYPSYFDLRAMDYKAPITVWNQDSNTYETYSDLDGDNYLLSPMQAFFVQVPLGTSAIHFMPEGRCLLPDNSNKFTTRSMATGRELINLKLSDGANADKTRISIAPQSSFTYRIEEDAAKFMSPELSVPQIYTLDEERVQYAINVQPLSNGQSVRIGYHAGKAGEYVLSAERSDREVWLYDALTGVTQNLTTESYRFTSNQGNFEDRFKLYIGISPTSIQNGQQEICEVVSAEGGVIVKGQPEQKIEVYTLAGVKVTEANLGQTDTFVPLTQGAYLVKVGSTVCKSLVY